MRESIRPETALRELSATPDPIPLHAWRVLRYLQLWFAVAAEERAELFDDGALGRLEEEILFASYDDEIRLPLAVIVACIGSDAPGERLAWACMCAGDWAAGQRALAVMLAFQSAAACATDSPTYRLVAELAAVRVALETGPAADDLSRGVLLGRRRALEAEIAGLGGPSATRDGLTIRPTGGRTDGGLGADLHDVRGGERR